MAQQISELSDRELLELILSNQVNLAQRVFRINNFFLSHYGKEYIKEINHKGEIFEKLLSEQQGLLQQLRKKK